MHDDKTVDDKAGDDDKPGTDKLPGNHGQFGNDNATEDYKPLQPATPGPQPTDPGGRA